MFALVPCTNRKKGKRGDDSDDDTPAPPPAQETKGKGKKGKKGKRGDDSDDDATPPPPPQDDEEESGGRKVTSEFARSNPPITPSCTAQWLMHASLAAQHCASACLTVDARAARWADVL